MDGQNKRSRNITTSTLPKDIIDEEILPLVDVKSLLKFRCVSKPWCSLIDSKTFIKKHHQNSIKNQSFPHQSVIIQSSFFWPKQCPMLPLLNGSNLDPFLSEDPTSNQLGSFQVVGCCNGLVCILKNPATFIIWNPSTRMAKKLPEIPGSINTANCGFGCVESIGEYKVFATFNFADLNKVEGKLYSSKTKSWKTTEPIKCSFWQVGVLVGEKLHFRFGEIKKIGFLDLKSEVFGSIEIPIPFVLYDYTRLFGVLGDSTCLLQYNHGGDVAEVWVVKEYGVKDCWERVVSGDRVLELLRQPRSTPSIVWPNGEILVFFRSAFLVYNPRENVFRVLHEYNRYNSRYHCIESLESPHAL